jgi:hypothetical protein
LIHAALSLAKRASVHRRHPEVFRQPAFAFRPLKGG